MYSIEDKYTFTYEIKRSKFIAYIMPYERYVLELKRLRSTHPKARHFVTAYRYLNQFNQIVESSSDDGEPSGTSGRPSLTVLQGAELINVAVVIVRYFGGVKLGTGGLVRAYTQAVLGVVESAMLLTYEELKPIEFCSSYSAIEQILFLLKKCNIEQIERTYEADLVLWSIEASDLSLKQFYATVPYGLGLELPDL